MPAEHPNRRQKILIDLPVQLGMALRLVVLWAGTMLLASLIAVLMQFFENPESRFLDHLTNPQHWAPTIAALVVTMPIAVLQLFRFSHRFAGPVYRLRKEMRGLVERGSAPRLKFRKHDYWQEMADEFNAVAELVKSNPSVDKPSQEPLEPVGGAL